MKAADCIGWMLFAVLVATALRAIAA